MSRTRKKADATLTQSMAKLLQEELVPDLKERAEMPGVDAALRQRWTREKAARRTADAYEIWISHVAEQVGAAWILSIAFVRTLEDRGLLDRRRLAGPEAYDSEHAFFQLFPALGPRDYLLSVFRELSRLPGAEDLLGPKHNPAWRLAPSNAAAQKLLDAWRRDDSGRTPLWTFEGTDTRFLGDLYQDLSEDARERFALLQTPGFVERFILGLTLDPAVQEFGLDQVRLIDPTCGSGHFLLGAYDRLFDLRLAREPGTDRRAHALAALGQVHGVDLNPYAIAIARFRLTLSFLEKARIRKLKDAPRLPLQLAVADSLLVAARGTTRQFAEEAADRGGWGFDLFDFEDEAEARRILGQGYHAVVGNPPYITCKDAVLREEYRKLYPRSAFRIFSLAAPFTERFFQLAVGGGFVGLINANSFTKREFGKKLIEDVLANLDLTHVLDSAGAFIPGHGTPTVLLAGRNRAPDPEMEVRAVQGKRGEPAVPADPEHGLVWSSLVAHLNDLDYEDEFISVANMPRSSLARHPWSLGGGGSAGLKLSLEERASRRLSEAIDSIGIGCITKQDEVFAQPRGALRRAGVEEAFERRFVIGVDVRDWAVREGDWAIFPYDNDAQTVPESRIPRAIRFMWPFREVLYDRKEFGGATYRQAGRPWYEYGQISADRLRASMSIAFAFVATHNHFVLDRGGNLLNRSAPVVTLPKGATEGEHFGILGYLNSSTACFWMKQAMMNKAGSGIGRGVQDEAWESRFEFDGTKMAKVPLPQCPAEFGLIARCIDGIARDRQSIAPRALLDRAIPTGKAVDDILRAGAVAERHSLGRMCALQEELDWVTYETLGLLTAEDRELLMSRRRAVWPSFPRGLEDSKFWVEVTGLNPGHRAFEVILARDSTARGEPTAWFERNGYRSPSEIATTYPPSLQRLIEARVAIIDRNPHVRLIEKPEFKRRWTFRVYHQEAKLAAEGWLLDAVERVLAQKVVPTSVRRVADEVLTGRTAREVARWAFGDETAAGIASLCAGDSIADVAALRFAVAGLEKRALWERTWTLQRLEDAGEALDGPIPVPPEYEPKDFLDQASWRLRGKLDVPKERFISYPGAEHDDDKSPIIGWAGWDHLQRAQALAALYQERKNDAWTKERLTPLLAGLLELVPWLKQWHNEPNAAFGGQRLGDYFAQYVESEARELGLTLDDLRAWRPVAKGRGRKVRNSPAASEGELT